MAAGIYLTSLISISPVTPVGRFPSVYALDATSCPGTTESQALSLKVVATLMVGIVSFTTTLKARAGAVIGSSPSLYLIRGLTLKL